MGMYFAGAYFDYEECKLRDNPILAAHFIHSITRMQYNKGKLNYHLSMTFQEFWESNKDFFNAVVKKYKQERNYDIPEHSLSYGINWFLQGANIVNQ
jgi:hypothetical protein